MATGNLDKCLKVTLPHEGGWSDHPKDPGGATMKGITLETFREYKPGATKTQLRNISDADVREIYDDGFWRPICGDSLPFGVDLATFDFGVNSGTERAARYLQLVIGAKADGRVGPETVKLAAASDGKTVIQRLCAKRLGFMKALKIWSTFGKGWSRRVADVEAKAVAMWLAAGRGLSSSDRRELEAEAGKAADKAIQQKQATGTVAGGGAVVGGGDAVLTGDINWWLIGGLAVLVAVVVAVLAVRARQNRDRADAYASVAASGGAI